MTPIEQTESAIVIDGRLGAEKQDDRVRFSMVVPGQDYRAAVTIDQAAVDQLIDWLRPGLRQRAEQAEADVAVYKTLLWGAAAHHTASRRDSRDNRHDAIVCIDYLFMLFEAAGASGGFAIGFTEPAAVQRVAGLFGLDPDALDMALDDATQPQDRRISREVQP